MTSHMSLGVTVYACRSCLSSFFELDLLKQQIGHQSPQPCIFELEFSDLVALIAHSIGLAGGRFAPAMQGHDAHTKRARNAETRDSPRVIPLALSPRLERGKKSQPLRLFRGADQI